MTVCSITGNVVALAEPSPFDGDVVMTTGRLKLAVAFWIEAVFAVPVSENVPFGMVCDFPSTGVLDVMTDEVELT